jgi:hypothetical protein
MSQEFLQATAESLARLHTKEAIGAAVEILRDKSQFAADRLKAAQMILDRGHGKPTSVTVSVPAKRATAQQLINMTEEQLLAIIASRQRNAPTEDSATTQTKNLPARFHGAEVVDAEIVDEDELMRRRFAGLVDEDDEDPTK